MKNSYFKVQLRKECKSVYITYAYALQRGTAIYYGNIIMYFVI